MPPEETPQEETPKPRRRWKRWVFSFLILLVAFLVWANGPGIRWGIKKVILQQLEAQKLSGTFEVTGTALSGLAIHDLSLTGESKIRSVESKLVQIDWSLSSLLKKELEAITLEKLHLVFDPKAPALPPKEEESQDADKEKKSLADTLNLVRGFLIPAEISLTDIRVEVVETTSVSLASFTHKAGTSDFIIADLRTVDHLDRPIHNSKSTLAWTEEGFALDEFTLLPQLAIRNLVFHPEKQVSAEVFIDDSKISLSSDLKKAHHVTLDSPSLPIATVADLVKPDLPANGVITALEIDTAKGFVNIQGRDLQWEEQKLASASIEARTPDLLSPFDQAIAVKIALEDRLTVDGTVTPAKELLDSAAELAFTVNDPAIPTVTGDLVYDSREARVLASMLDDLSITARYFVDSSTYQAEAISKIKDAGQLDKMLTGPLDFSLTAKGDIRQMIHSGTLKLDQLKLDKPGLPDATTSGVITYDWPKNVTVTDLKMTSSEGRIQANLAWQDDLLTISQLDLIEGTTKLLAATAKLPAPLTTRSLDDLLASPEPILLKVKSQPLTFNKLSSFAPIPPELSAIVEADLSLSGTFAKPTLNGFASLLDFRTSKQKDLPPLDLKLDFKTENQKLLLTAKATEPGGPLLNLDGKLPFLPRAWLDKEKDPTDSPLDIRLFSPDLDLRRVQPFVPVIESITGNLKLDVLVSGTLSDPKYSGSAKARIPKMRLAKSPVSDFRKTNFDVTFLGKVATIQPSSISASGGTAKVRGTVNLEGKEPVFDVNVNGRYLLLHRSADYTFRGHTDLNLRGPLSGATVSGKLEITESLFYKDVEILPFGVPRTTEIPKPNLPGFSQAPQPSTSPTEKSGGVMDWKLDIAVTTLDPILIRGNLARGEITGNVRVSGTIGDPKTSGSLVTNELEADLPFSNLQVSSGIVTLRPNALTNPLIDLRGSSTIGQYTIQVYLNGPVQKPNLVLTSDPPLPESEIMLLLATGSASDQLEDSQVASQKALQYLLEGIRRRNRGKDKTVFQRLLKNSDQIELSLGDTNQFSGRKYSSATLEISEQWDFTTQIDDAGQTRALVVFSIRFH